MDNIEKEQKLRQVLSDYSTGKIDLKTFIDRMQPLKEEYGL